MIQVVIRVEFDPVVREQILAKVFDTALMVRKDPGLIEMSVVNELDVPLVVDQSVDFPEQISTREDMVVVMEKWTSLKVFQSHLQTQHVQTAWNEGTSLMRSISIKVYRTLPLPNQKMMVL